MCELVCARAVKGVFPFTPNIPRTDYQDNVLTENK